MCMKKILFEKSYSDNTVQDSEINELLALTANEPLLKNMSEQERITVNRSVLKGMFLAEDIGGSVLLECTEEGLCFSLTKKF